LSLNNDYPGYFLAIDAIDGAGKTTAKSTIVSYLKSRYGEDQIVCTREPGGTPIAEKLRALLLEDTGEEISAEAEALIVSAARNIHISNLIKPSLDSGKIVVTDRFESSTYAYQGSGGDIDYPALDWLSDFACKNIRPDSYLFLDLPPEVSLKRAGDRSSPDRLEMNGIDYFKRVRKGFKEFANRSSSKSLFIDASDDINTVQNRVIKALDELATDIDNKINIQKLEL